MDSRPVARLRDDAQRILRAGIAAADPRAAVLRALSREGDALRVGGGEPIDLATGEGRLGSIVGQVTAAGAAVRGAEV
ncbi:MAG TPA: hypothetical protein VGR37_20385, partial [Longimicrobiaceae bacterium]|nr:hypothetical protein [Longimicrobiaceae bacterium]